MCDNSLSQQDLLSDDDSDNGAFNEEEGHSDIDGDTYFDYVLL